MDESTSKPTAPATPPATEVTPDRAAESAAFLVPASAAPSPAPLAPAAAPVATAAATPAWAPPALATAASPMVPSAAGAARACPHCGHPNPLQAGVCLLCSKQVSRPCPSCGLALSLAEGVCPRCHTVLAEYDHQRFTEGLVTELHVREARRESEVRVETLEARHRVRAVQGVFFWLVVLAAFGGLLVVGAVSCAVFL